MHMGSQTLKQHVNLYETPQMRSHIGSHIARYIQNQKAAKFDPKPEASRKPKGSHITRSQKEGYIQPHRRTQSEATCEVLCEAT